MGPHKKSIIRYHFAGNKYSPELVSHVFGYLSALADYLFVADNDSPDILLGNRDEISPGACIICRHDETLVRNRVGYEKLLDYDPIDKIARRLTLTIRSGPYSENNPTSSPEKELLLSEVIADLFDLLARTGLSRGLSDRISLWPNDRPFCVAITHDVDIIRRSLPGSVRLLLNRQVPGGFGGLVDSGKSFLLNTRNPYDRLSEWLDIGKKRGLKSTIFVFSGARQHRADPIYHLSMLAKDFEKIRTDGFEIAYHSSIGCHLGDGMSEGKSQLEMISGTNVAGIRPHYLSAAFPEYWRSAAEMGITYSSSFGFAETIGFIEGIDLPIIPFDLANNKPLGIVEIPIAIMDCGLIGKDRAGSAVVFDRARSLIDRSSRSGGLIVLDWHERTLYERDYPGWGELCIRLIDYSLEKGAHFGKMHEIADRIMTRYKGLS
jgi:hypothetical protein